ncbi:MAG: phosphatidylglycerophosphatase A [Candidatus Omnitrophota bacterium]
MNLRKTLTIITSSFFFVGYLPFIPGTFGSIAGVGLFYLLRMNQALYICGFLVVLCAGFLVGGQAEKIYAKKDPACVVIDEVTGMLLALAFLPFYNIVVVTVAFFFFRLLDTLKPYPAYRLQRLRGSAGIMVDDLIAGLYTNIILQVALRLAVFKAS